MMNSFAPRVVFGALLVLASVCTDARRTNPGAVRRDSSGVEIVENARQRWTGSEWTIPSSPVFSVGASSGSEAPYQFSRIVNALRLSNGAVAVADGVSAR